MKNAFVLAAVAALLMTSCERDDLNLEGSDANELLVGASAEVEGTSGIEMTTLEAPETIMGDPVSEARKHRWLKHCKPVKPEDLPAAVIEYIDANYPDANIKRACQFRNGNFVVIIMLADGSFKMLEFGKEGQFIKELKPKKHGPKDPKKRLDPLQEGDLPASVTDYLGSNYAGYDFLRAGRTSSGAYLVVIEVNGEKKMILFDDSGNFVKEL